MSVNKYAGRCEVCGSTVPAKGGTLVKRGGCWGVRHLVCAGGESNVIETRFASGAVVTQNRRGVCEDAPCCGCCGVSESGYNSEYYGDY